MTSEEAYKVGKIACEADGGCHVCGRQLINELQEAFSEHAETFQTAYKDYHSYGEDDDD